MTHDARSGYRLSADRGQVSVGVKVGGPPLPVVASGAVSSSARRRRGADEPLAGRRRADVQDGCGLVGAQAVPGDQGEQLPVVRGQPAERVADGGDLVGRRCAFALAVRKVVAAGNALAPVAIILGRLSTRTNHPQVGRDQPTSHNSGQSG
jgi:hypothetical protein